jgi:hypothetical protein
MSSSVQLSSLEERLNHFDLNVRKVALTQLIDLSNGGTIAIAPLRDVANLHCHTFYSFNAYGYSPSALAWLAKKNGYRLMGIVDFDVLDGVDEFLDSCQFLEVRGSAGMETRVFLPEFSTREINSPGEPGVSYYMGVGFTTNQVPVEALPVLTELHKRAEHRLRTMVNRLNDFFSPVNIDYDKELLPLTPGGNPTERHLVQAYLSAVERAKPDPVSFWSEKLGQPNGYVAEQINDKAGFQNLVRSRLMKQGGAGYIDPSPDTFPTVSEVNRLTLACGAIPCIAWLDGTSQGEQDIEELLDLLIAQEAAALNIVPDRNWNISNKGIHDQKVKKLYEIVDLANDLNLPLNIGTEMNSFGQRLLDDFDAPELLRVRSAFLDGAHFIYGHTVMQRTIGLGYQSEWAKKHFPTRKDRNQFYTQMGYKIPPGSMGLAKLRSLPLLGTPDEFLFMV